MVDGGHMYHVLGYPSELHKLQFRTVKNRWVTSMFLIFGCVPAELQFSTVLPLIGWRVRFDLYVRTTLRWHISKASWQERHWYSHYEVRKCPTTERQKIEQDDSRSWCTNCKTLQTSSLAQPLSLVEWFIVSKVSIHVINTLLLSLSFKMTF